MKIISVVIPTYNSMNLLEKTLESLCQQTLEKEYFEVIVADDGSSDKTEHIARRFSNYLTIKYCYQEDIGFRAAKARNMGLELAIAKYVFFLDSGVVLKRDALKIHLASVEPVTIHIGLCDGFEEHFVAENAYSHLIKENDFIGLFDSLNNHQSHQDCRQKLLSEMGNLTGFQTYPWLFFWGGHLFGETAYFKQVGGFDENFVSWGGEDVELGLRLSMVGFRLKLVLEAKAYHIPHKKAYTAGAQATQNNCVYIHQKHKLPITERMLTEEWDSIVRNP